ncbi:MAG: hypothetical protein CMJ64_21600 [Planctomycetaceae bacterium]|nr:hypothetical protein [Planctomycetaceae bacterium]
MKRLAVAGLGIATLSKASVELELEQKRLAVVRVKGWPLRRTMTVVHHRQKYRSKALIAFLDELKSQAKTPKRAVRRKSR